MIPIKHTGTHSLGEDDIGNMFSGKDGLVQCLISLSLSVLVLFFPLSLIAEMREYITSAAENNAL